MITSQQIRAARGMINWTRQELAERVGMSPQAIQKIEEDSVRPHRNTLELLQQTFNDAGVEFLSDGGIRPLSTDMQKHVGETGIRAFFDDVYKTVLEGGEICVSGVREQQFTEALGDYDAIHNERMAKIRKKVMVRALLQEGDSDFVCDDYCDYRWVNAESFDAVPFYVYGNKLATILFDVANGPLIYVINSSAIAQAYRKQFDMMWRRALQPRNLTKKVGR